MPFYLDASLAVLEPEGRSALPRPWLPRARGGHLIKEHIAESQSALRIDGVSDPEVLEQQYRQQPNT
jgi:hypothetical protein